MSALSTFSVRSLLKKVAVLTRFQKKKEKGPLIDPSAPPQVKTFLMADPIIVSTSSADTAGAAGLVSSAGLAIP